MNHRSTRSTRSIIGIAALACAAAACGGDAAGDANAAAVTKQAGATASTGGSGDDAKKQQSGPDGGGKSDGKGGKKGGGGGGGAAGRPASSITLAPTDVAIVKRESIEAGIAVTGDLHPIETIGVRARIEGDLTGVFVREGQHVSSGQLLAQFESSEAETTQKSAEADLSSAKSDQAAAQWNLDQSRELFKAGAIAERDLKVAEQTVVAADAKVAAANARLRSTSNGSRDTKVFAPASGVIDKRLVQTGERVTRGQQLFSLVRNDALELTAAVPARQGNVVVVGQAVHFVADGREFDGKVARVSPTIDPTNRSITVYVQVPNANGALKGGTFATGRVVQRVVTGALVVSMPAVRQAQETGQTYVYRIVDRVVDIAPVQLGVIDERAGKAEVLSGLAEGDRVIVGNVGTLGRGMQATIVGADDQAGGSRKGGSGGGKGKGKGQASPAK